MAGLDGPARPQNPWAYWPLDLRPLTIVLSPWARDSARTAPCPPLPWQEVTRWPDPSQTFAPHRRGQLTQDCV